jgi:hypothetical protein
MKLAISEIKVGFRARFDIGNIAELVEDIKTHGLLHPVVITPDYELIAGYRRLKAAESLGWLEIPITIQVPSTKYEVPSTNNSSFVLSSVLSLVQYDMQLSENMNRKELNPLELSEAILERKHRFEQVYGKIQNGGDHTSEEYQKSSFVLDETAQPNFYETTAKLLKMNSKTIYRFLQLKDLDPDLKEQVSNRTIGYREALTQQAERNRTKKQPSKPQKTPFKSIGLPNQEQIAPLQKQYQAAPNLMQLFMLIQHSFQTVRKLQEQPLEYAQFELEYLYLMIQQFEVVVGYYNEVLSQLHQEQERKISELAIQQSVDSSQ